MHKRFLLTPSADQPYPLYIESIGDHDNQERIVRDEGYPCYHWLQTYDGEGELHMEGRTVPLAKGSGVLLLSQTAHAYGAVTDVWCTQYVTFGGELAESILTMLGLHQSACYRWEPDSPMNTALDRIIAHAETGSAYTGYDASSDIYRFLITLKKHGQTHNRASLTNRIGQLQPLLVWLEKHASDPDIGLADMARVLEVTPRHLNTLFQQAFGASPYSYLILLRLRKSKEMLLNKPELTVKAVSEQVGFRDPSHFVASFRKHVGLTPDRFRQLN